LVAEVTDDKSLEKEVRKRPQIEHAATKFKRAKIMKLADKTSNLRSLVKSPPDNWNLQRRREYLDWALAVAAGLRGTNKWLEAQFDEAAEQLAASCTGSARL
jgi:GTP diphosphokinase / guanosine-3',5'-bis(diphosphate) 3'-diphosphatase